MISVVVTCHNLGRYLDEAIDSVLAQSFQDFEIIVVDDGSTDLATRQLLDSYSRPKTRVLRSENRGLPGARNFGIRHSRGEVICSLDADDKLAPTYFEKAVRVLKDDPTTSFVSHWLRTFGDEESDWTPTLCDLQSMLLHNLVNGAALVRREPLLAVGGFDESMTAGCEDWDLWLTMIEQGYRGVIIPEVLFFYRRRADSMSRLMMNGNTHAHLFRKLVDKHRESYRRFLPELLAEKDTGMAGLLREIYDLELEHEAKLAPALRRASEEIAALEMAAERVRPHDAQEVDRALVVEERARIAEELDRINEERAHMAKEHELMKIGVDAIRAELESVRGSMSWRITGPLRAVAGWYLARRHAR